MTNEQLIILLQEYANHLGAIIEGLKEEMKELDVPRESEYSYRWKGEGEEPKFAIKPFAKGYESIETPTGPPFMLMPLVNFKEQIESSINTLRGERK